MKNQTLFDQLRGIRGRIKYRQCQHGKILIDNYNPVGICELCFPQSGESFFVPNTQPFFNRGLGCMTNGTRDAEKKAKKKGLIAIGDATPKQVFKNLYPNHRLTKGMK